MCLKKEKKQPTSQLSINGFSFILLQKGLAAHQNSSFRLLLSQDGDPPSQPCIKGKTGWVYFKLVMQISYWAC